MLYPVTEGTTFDHGYYRDHHAPLAVRTWGLDSAEINKVINGPYVARVNFAFESLEAMTAALSFEDSAAASADVATYTTIQPVSQVSEII